jgi:hypothetical protein
MLMTTSTFPPETLQKRKVTDVTLLSDSMWNFKDLRTGIYLAARIHQYKNFNATIRQSRYAKPMVFRFLEGAGIKISTCHMEGFLLSTNFVLAAKYLPMILNISVKLNNPTTS